jgi:hypothetical protein
MESAEELVSQSNPMDADVASGAESKPLAERDEGNTSDRQKLAALLGLDGQKKANSDADRKQAKLAAGESPEHASKIVEHGSSG